jgi:hypothetical protein
MSKPRESESPVSAGLVAKTLSKRSADSILSVARYANLDVEFFAVVILPILSTLKEAI